MQSFTTPKYACLMILREHKAADGSPAWLLISQVDHAHLSGQLAAAWGAAPFTVLEGREQLLPAIYHHDDGWADWEKRPSVDADTGRPIDFLEMPLDAALAIWRSSILAASRHGPLAGYVVSGHFAQLLAGSQRLQENAQLTEVVAQWWSPEEIAETARQDTARAALRSKLQHDRDMRGHLARTIASLSVSEAKTLGFLDEQSWLQCSWLGEMEEMHNRPLEVRALEQLQFFDALSLWFCMAERDDPQVFEPPGGPEVTFSPEGADRLHVSPWPFREGHIQVEVAGRCVPRQHYRSADELAQTRREEATLVWTLVPAKENP